MAPYQSTASVPDAQFYFNRGAIHIHNFREGDQDLGDIHKVEDDRDVLPFFIKPLILDGKPLLVLQLRSYSKRPEVISRNFRIPLVNCRPDLTKCTTGSVYGDDGELHRALKIWKEERGINFPKRTRWNHFGKRHATYKYSFLTLKLGLPTNREWTQDAKGDVEHDGIELMQAVKDSDYIEILIVVDGRESELRKFGPVKKFEELCNTYEYEDSDEDGVEDGFEDEDGAEEGGKEIVECGNQKEQDKPGASSTSAKRQLSDDPEESGNKKQRQAAADLETHRQEMFNKLHRMDTAGLLKDWNICIPQKYGDATIDVLQIAAQEVSLRMSGYVVDTMRLKKQL